MILCSDKSTIIAPYKCGTKSLVHTERRLANPKQTPNTVWATELLEILFHKEIPLHYQESLSEYNLRNLSELTFSTNKKPFFVVVRDTDLLYRAQILQGLRQFTYDNPIFNHPITFANDDTDFKHKFFESLIKLYPSIRKHVFTNEHYIKQTFMEAVPLLFFIKAERPDIYEKLFIINLDNYPREEKAIERLVELNVLDLTYMGEKINAHSTKNMFFPDIFDTNTLNGLERLPYKNNQDGLHILQSIFFDRVLTNNTTARLYDM